MRLGSIGEQRLDCANAIRVDTSDSRSVQLRQTTPGVTRGACSPWAPVAPVSPLGSVAPVSPFRAVALVGKRVLGAAQVTDVARFTVDSSNRSVSPTNARKH